MRGTPGEDRIHGSSGDDIIIDTTDSSADGGYDTYEFGPNWGYDVVVDTDQRGLLSFNGVSINDLDFANDRGDLVITAGLNTVYFEQYFTFDLAYDLMVDGQLYSDPFGGSGNPRQVILWENFNDGVLNGPPWSYAYDVREEDGVLVMDQNQTDLRSRAFYTFEEPVFNASIEFDRFEHAATTGLGQDNYYGRFFMTFVDGEGNETYVNLRNQRSDYPPSNDNDPQNYNHPLLSIGEAGGPSDRFFARSVESTDLYDTWVSTLLEFDSATGQVLVDIDYDGAAEFDLVDERLIDTGLAEFSVDAYGWFTGHYAYLDNLIVTGITGLPVEDTPNSSPVANSEVLTVIEGETLVANLLTGTNGAVADTDADGDVLEIASARDGLALPGEDAFEYDLNTEEITTFGPLELRSDGTLVYNTEDTPTLGAGDFASIFIAYTVSDGMDTGVAEAEIVIFGRNADPVLSDYTFEVEEDGQLILGESFFTSLAVADPDGHALTITDTTDPSFGQFLAPTAEGYLVYQPNADFNGEDMFTFNVEDGFGGSASATVTINVLPVNDAPIVVDASTRVLEDTVLSTNLAGFASDVDDATLSFALIGGNEPSNGIAELDPNGTLTYTPSANFFGTDTFQYAVTDLDGLRGEAEYTIEVLPENDAPVLLFVDPIVVPENTEDVVIVTATDEENDPLEFSITGGADADQFEIDSNTGALSFRTAPDFEAPTDADGNNQYELEVSVFDGVLSDDIFLFVEVDDEEEAAAPPPVVSGGGSSQVFGSEADEVIQPNAGTMKTVLGGGGADVFDFSDTVSNGAREFRTILDYSDDDAINLGSGNVIHHVSGNNLIQLFVDGDFDVITVVGSESLSDIEFV